MLRAASIWAADHDSDGISNSSSTLGDPDSSHDSDSHREDGLIKDLRSAPVEGSTAHRNSEIAMASDAQNYIGNV